MSIQSADKKTWVNSTGKRWSVFLSLCLMGLLAIVILPGCTGGSGNSSSSNTASATGSGDSGAQPVSWSSNVQGASIFPATPATITVSGATVLSAAASGDFGAEDPLAAVEPLDVTVIGNQATFTRNDGWPYGSYSFSASLSLSDGSTLNPTLNFTVQNPPPKEFASCLPSAFLGPNNAIFYFQEHKDIELGVRHLWKINPDGSGRTQLTTGATKNSAPRNDYDGRVSFTSNLASPSDVFRMDPDGTNVCRVTKTYLIKGSPQLSPAGDSVVYSAGGDVEVLPLGGGNILKLTDDETVTDGAPAWCANDQIVYVSHRAGTHQIYRINPDGSGDTKISNLSGGVTGRINCCTDGASDTWVLFIHSGWAKKIRIDGTGLTNVAVGGEADFSPDCSQVVVLRNTATTLVTANSDGSGGEATIYTSSDGQIGMPSW